MITNILLEINQLRYELYGRASTHKGGLNLAHKVE